MENKLDFNEFEKPEAEKVKKKAINFTELPKDTENILGNVKTEETNKAFRDKYLNDDPITVPLDGQVGTSYLSLVLSPNFRELELMIRGLEYVKRYNPILNKEEIILRRIKDHPLNETGINKIMQELKVYCSPEIKLGRKKAKDYYLSVQHVGHSIVRLVYKNLKNFGMDTQIKQRNAKSFCNAIVEMIDASYSRSIEGKENDLSRATEFKIEGNIDTLNDPAKLFNKNQKENMKN